MKEWLEKCRAFAGKEFSCSLWWKLVTFTVLTVVAGAALLVYIVDPNYRYRLPKFYKTVYYDIYATAPRLLTDMEYDLFMIGTSMCRNFFLDDIDKTFHSKSLKFAAPGATIMDLRKFVDMAVEAKEGKLKRIIFSLDIYSLNKKVPHWKDFSYMYRKDHKEDYKYLFHKETYSNMLYLLKRAYRPKGKRKYQADKNRMFSTEHDKSKYGMEYVIYSTRFCCKIRHTQTPFSPVSKRNLEEELLAMVDSYPDITFTFYLPPYHIYNYCLSHHFGEAEKLIELRKDVLTALLRRKNVLLHDFQSVPEIVCNGDYFTDIQHFSSRLAKIILRDLASGKYRLRTPEDIEKNTGDLRRLIEKTMPRFRKDILETPSVTKKGGK